MYKIVFLDLAIKDMENITKYISHSLLNKTAALKLADEFLKTAQSLIEFPYKNAEFISAKKLKK